MSIGIAFPILLSYFPTCHQDKQTGLSLNIYPRFFMHIVVDPTGGGEGPSLLCGGGPGGHSPSCGQRPAEGRLTHLGRAHDLEGPHPDDPARLRL